MTGRMLEALDRVLRLEGPDWVLVYGDTNSTLAAALAAAKLNIPVAHVEAGLRSFNKRMPEEVNRVLTDHCSDLLFSPTDSATINLKAEGVSLHKIEQVGDVMFDAVKLFGELKPKEGPALIAQDQSKNYVLVTVHRQENTDSPVRLEAIVRGLAEVAKKMRVIFPVHPRTRKTLAALDLDALIGAVEVIEPVGYLEMVRLQKNAAVIATDSGGVQKEAFFHRVPCVTMRDETEWTELVASGWNRLAPPTSSNVVSSAILTAVDSRGADIAPYGTGDAAERIVERLLNLN